MTSREDYRTAMVRLAALPPGDLAAAPDAEEMFVPAGFVDHTLAARRRRERQATCNDCPDVAQADGGCEVKFPRGCCRSRWARWIEAAGSVCPDGRWSAEKDAETRRRGDAESPQPEGDAT
jgi:hypothetical protein